MFFILFGVTTDLKKEEKKNEVVNSKVEEPNKEVNIAKTQETPKIKIEKLKEKRESRNDGEFNQMTLFVVDSSITLDELKEFCITHKADYSDGYFQILVFFKDRKSSRFPDNPLTGGFLDEADLTKIKAVYTLNNTNGYSKLDYYEKDSYVSHPNSIDIK